VNPTLEETKAAVAAWFKRWSRARHVPHSAALELKAILDAAPCADDDVEERRARLEDAISKPEAP